MKKRMITGLLGGTLMLAMSAGAVQARTYAYESDSGRIICIPEDVPDACAAEAMEDISAEHAQNSGPEQEETVVVDRDVQEEAADSAQSKGKDSGIAYETTEATASRALTRKEREEQERQIQEYEEAGIGYDEKEGWLWEEKPIYYLFDESGSMCMNGSEEAKKNKIYVVVKRNDDGTIKEAKQVTVEDAIREQIVMRENE